MLVARAPDHRALRVFDRDRFRHVAGQLDDQVPGPHFHATAAAVRPQQAAESAHAGPLFARRETDVGQLGGDIEIRLVCLQVRHRGGKIRHDAAGVDCGQALPLGLREPRPDQRGGAQVKPRGTHVQHDDAVVDVGAGFDSQRRFGPGPLFGGHAKFLRSNEPPVCGKIELEAAIDIERFAVFENDIGQGDAGARVAHAAVCVVDGEIDVTAARRQLPLVRGHKRHPALETDIVGLDLEVPVLLRLGQGQHPGRRQPQLAAEIRRQTKSTVHRYALFIDANEGARHRE